MGELVTTTESRVSTEAEVSRQALGFFHTLAASGRPGTDALRARLAALELAAGSFVRWADIVDLYALLDGVCRDGETVEDLGCEVSRTVALRGFFTILRYVATPKLLFQLIFKWAGQRIWRHITVDYEELSNGWLVVDMEIPRHYRGCENFFRVCVGTCRSTPHLLALDDAIVHATFDSHRGRFRIRPPQARTFVHRSIRRIRTWVSARYVVQELASQQQELSARYLELQQTCEDLEQRRLEARKAHARAQTALATRRRFLSRVNHELRSPLHGVIASLAALESEKGPTELLRSAQGSAASLARLLEGLLRFSEISGATPDPVPTEFGLKGVFAEVLERHRPAAAAKGIGLTLRGACPDASVSMDRRALTDAVSALVDNAIRFTNAGAVEVVVAISGNDEELCVEVHDTGTGIAASEVESLFRPFAQLDEGAQRAHGGLGLGLAWARRAAAILGGTLAIQSSEPGVGTTFALTTPLTCVAAPEPRPPLSGRPSALVCDDNATNRLVLSRLMEALGYQVAVAEDGARAVEACKASPFDLLLMDCEMPVLDGFGATRSIRALPLGARVPIVAVTAYTSDEDRSSCFAAGMTDFLEKPLRVDGLRAVLSRLGLPAQPGPQLPIAA